MKGMIVSFSLAITVRKPLTNKVTFMFSYSVGYPVLA